VVTFDQTAFNRSSYFFTDDLTSAVFRYQGYY